MELYNNIQCVTFSELIDSGIVSASNFKQLKLRNQINVLTRACRGVQALIEYDSLPTRFKIAYEQMFGKTDAEAVYSLLGRVRVDNGAYEFFNEYVFDSGKALPVVTQAKYRSNASVLIALHEILTARKADRKARGGNMIGVWDGLLREVNEARQELGHTLPKEKRGLQRVYNAFADNYPNYESLISGKFLNDAASKIKTEEQCSVLRQLLRKHTNLDNQQVCDLYNEIAQKTGWAEISTTTVGNYRKKWKLTLIHGQKGVSYFNNNHAMQNRRSAPENPMQYWTVDGWDVELLYQATEVDKKGHSKVTYDNRMTIVVILDPSTNYPVGYAIGTHETPALIRQALRNAFVHTQELFGSMYRVAQLQTDRYAKKTLSPFYEACTELYVPAKAHNAKAKRIERYFAYINKKYCQLCNNWSGVSIASGSKKQPNAEYLNKIHGSFPDAEGVIAQIEHIMQLERAKSGKKYYDKFLAVPEAERLLMSQEQFLLTLGETTGFTNSLTGAGVIAAICGQKMHYDCFDAKFREFSHEKWTLRFNPEDLTQVLATNSDCTRRFILKEKHLQPMAIADRTEDDNLALSETRAYNKLLEENIKAQMDEDYLLTQGVIDNPKLNNTTVKLILTDSHGQHKNNRNKAIAQKVAKVNRIQEAKIVKENQKEFEQTQEEYLRGKTDYSKYTALAD